MILLIYLKSKIEKSYMRQRAVLYLAPSSSGVGVGIDCLGGTNIGGLRDGSPADPTGGRKSPSAVGGLKD